MKNQAHLKSLYHGRVGRANHRIHLSCQPPDSISIYPDLARAKLIPAMLLISILSVTTHAQFWSGSGTEADPFLIQDANDMQDIGAHAEHWDKHFLLTNDIDLSPFDGQDGRPMFNIIGNTITKFTGKFNGDGHVISNFIYHAAGTNFVALFGYVDNGELINLGISNANINTETGNLVATLAGLFNGTISNCYAIGSLTGNDTVGGLVGYNWYGSISNCYALGCVTGNDWVGGLVGKNDGGNIEYSFTAASVSGTHITGGLVGYDDHSGIYTNCFWNQEINPTLNPIGNWEDPNHIFGESTVNMQTQTTYTNAGWDFISEWINGPSDDWGFSGESSYPVLWWQLDPLPNLPSFSGGAGTENDPYLIADANDLNQIGHNYRLMNKHFRLLNHIDLNEVNFFIMANPAFGFSGNFDGNGYTIENLNVIPADSHYIGLFRKVNQQGKIHKLGLINVNIDSDTSNFVGALAGHNSGIIDNSYISGSITGGDYVGALVGYNNAGIIQNCSAQGVLTGYGPVGGITGYSRNATISNCYTFNTINGIDSNVGGLIGDSSNDFIHNCHTDGTCGGNWKVGGLVGQSTDNTVITNCTSTGNISGNWYVGGLIGYNSLSNISNSSASGDNLGSGNYIGGLIGMNHCGLVSSCYATGTVGSVATDQYAGGLLGGNSGEVSNCYAKGNVWGDQDVGGLIGYTWAGSIVSNCYAAGILNGNSNVGGLVGSNVSGNIYNYSFWDNTVNMGLTGIGNDNDPNVIGESTTNMKIKNTFIYYGWDFVGENINGSNDFWRICTDAVHYPKLSLEYGIGDFVCPDGVSLEDFTAIASAWLSSDGWPNWNDLCDLYDDDTIDILDLTLFANEWLEGR
ncbi:MAG: hypothetical protein JW860_15400 [Sedimentisphaerales bacterium]|nr:hypothetical protein [Sedimentisphaerales bacterium]